MSLASASVALIIFIDLVTGQGPPGLNNYLGPPPPRELLPQMAPQLQPIGYMPRGEYDNMKVSQKLAGKGDEYGKEEEGKLYGSGKEKSYESTPAPGVLASFSNSMSDAWKSLTTLGRGTRSVRDVSDAQAASSDDNFRSSGRSFDDYESRQYNNKGYLYFKVPRNLVCNNKY